MWRVRDNHVPPTFKDGTKIVSLRSGKRLITNFHNQTGLTLEAFWIDYQGTPVYYRTIIAGAKAEFYTFRHHPWFFRFASVASPATCLDSCFICVEELNKSVAFPIEKHPLFTLKLAKPAVWRPSNHHAHARADRVFASGVKSFLLVHNRLSRHPEIELQEGRQRSPAADKAWEVLSQVCNTCWSVCACLLSDFLDCSSSTSAQAFPTLDGAPASFVLVSPVPLATAGAALEQTGTAAHFSSTHATPERHVGAQHAGDSAAPATASGYEQHSEFSQSPVLEKDCTNLGDLPSDLVLDIISRWAPPVVPDVLPLLASDMKDAEGEDFEVLGMGV